MPGREGMRLPQVYQKLFHFLVAVVRGLGQSLEDDTLHLLR
jgi:hypothetical protein